MNYLLSASTPRPPGVATLGGGYTLAKQVCPHPWAYSERIALVRLHLFARDVAISAYLTAEGRGYLPHPMVFWGKYQSQGVN